MKTTLNHICRLIELIDQDKITPKQARAIISAVDAIPHETIYAMFPDKPHMSANEN